MRAELVLYIVGLVALFVLSSMLIDHGWEAWCLGAGMWLVGTFLCALDPWDR